MNKLKLKNCSSIYQCITPMFYISKLFGLAPFTLPAKNEVLKTSILDYFIFLLSESVHLYFVYYINIETYLINPASSRILNLCGFASVLFMLFISITSTIRSMFSQQSLNNILRIVSQCDDQVKTYFIQVLANYKI